MIALIQRVSSASVEVDGATIGAIGTGLLALVGVRPSDDAASGARLLERLLGYRVFPDEADRMNRSLRDTGGGLLLVPQFTLAADCRRGRRPSFDAAAPPDEARRLYELVVATLRAAGVPVETGEFQADMQVSLVNDGPVTFVLESRAA